MLPNSPQIWSADGYCARKTGYLPHRLRAPAEVPEFATRYHPIMANPQPSTMTNNSVMDQVRRNAVALISLVVAVTSLGYNTWRNERSEYNRNIRSAGFQLLLKLGQLQELVFLAHYDRDPDGGNPRRGWAYVLTVRDLSSNMPQPVPSSADLLFGSWQANWETLGAESGNVEPVVDSTDTMRAHVLAALMELD